MKYKNKFAALVLALAVTSAQAQLAPKNTTPNKVVSSIGILEYKDGAPSKATVEKVYDNLDLMHGVETFVNAYQGASTQDLAKEFNRVGVPDNSVLIFSGLMDSKSLFLTANCDVVYFWSVINVTDGPIVFEAPPLAQGVIDDMWFRWVTDIGLSGPDRGIGGKYLLLPPGYTGSIPEAGFIVLHLRTTRALLLGREFLQNNDPKPTEELVKKTTKIYPYQPGGYGTSIATGLQGDVKLARTPEGKLDYSWLKPTQQTKFVEGTGLVMNTIPPNDYSFFETLNELVQQEPVDALDPEIMGSLYAIGIVKGKPFNPDARMKKILTDAAAIGTATGRTLNWADRESEGFAYYPGGHWTNYLFVGGYMFDAPPPQVSADGIVTPYPTTGARKLNSRTGMFFYATGITPAMCMRLTEVGSQYIMATVDSKGEYFDGSKTYKIVLPPNIPAAKFWSLTLYDNQHRSMLETPQRFPRAGSQSYPSPAAVQNADGSTTVYFSPAKPAGVKDGNWIQTTPGKGWNTLLRFYSPLQPFFDKTWRAGDIELVK